MNESIPPDHALSAPQQAATPLLRQLEPTQHDGRFLRIGLGVWLGLVLTTAAGAVVFDPIGAFDTGWFQPLTWQGSDRKASVFLKYEPRPQLVVLGSSHMMKMSPPALSRLTGLRAFNFAISSARPEDLRAIVRFIEVNGEGALGRLLIGVDPEMFRNNEERGRFLVMSHHLRRYAASGGPSLLSSFGSTLLSSDVALLALRSAKLHLIDHTPPPNNYIVEPDGFMHFVRWEADLAAGTVDLEEKIRGSIRDYRTWYAGFTALDDVRVSDLRALLAAARERGVAVDVFMPPLHPRLLRALTRSGRFGARRRETAQLLHDLEGQGLLRVHPVDSLESFGGDPDGFFDGEHMTEANSTRLLAHLYAADARRAVQ